MVIRAFGRPSRLRMCRSLPDWAELSGGKGGPLGWAVHRRGQRGRTAAPASPARKGGGMPQISYPGPAGTVPGYLAAPAGGAGPWPGVVVIHEAFGLNDDIRAKADELAAHGYLALAPDLYGGRPWIRCVAGAFSQMRAGHGPCYDALDAAREFLAGRADSTGKTGVIGFCMGGGFALLCGPREGFGAVAVNYGDVPKNAEQALAGACPVVASFGARDRGMRKDVPETLERALTVLEIPHDVQVYPGSGHRFMSRASGVGGTVAKALGMSYQEADAADAWHRIYAFFGEHLAAPS
jgi:carboxymethylenebutenolidase